MNETLPKDRQMMAAALHVAWCHTGRCWPNPCVGAVLVDKGGTCIAVDVTALGGRPHAEARLLRHAGKRAEGGTLYVTLEPCCHEGETPPCTDMIIRACVRRVVVAMEDCDERMRGASIALLRDAGIHVTCGVMEEEAQRLYRGYVMRNRHGRPYVTAKLALSRDGMTARKRGERTLISNREALRYGHMLRLTCDAVLVGANTWRVDRPRLDCRLEGVSHGERCHLARVILDRRLTLSQDSALVRHAHETPLWIMAEERAIKEKGHAWKDKGCVLMALPYDVAPPHHVAVQDILSTLAERGVTHLLLEGGGMLFSSFVRCGYVDDIILFRGDHMLGEEGYAGWGGEAMLREYVLSRSVTLGSHSMECYHRV